MKLTSAAFAQGQDIPAKHTCDGADVSPALSWRDAPPETAAFALICDDPDAPAGMWVHWVLYNLPSNVTELREGDAGGGLQGRNDFRTTRYGGPCPPPGKPHRYFFKLSALRGRLDLPAGASKADVERAMRGQVLAEAQLMGTYARKRA
ncbi:MAG TPA: YbhB/YbcL family Raf kinase inhibitor-like protein [Gemmatimonadales bacterium]|nr:YbhB/YbcL family Raf kinase inhibitor-like protein [Gemmatimonadales bacterium]